MLNFNPIQNPEWSIIRDEKGIAVSFKLCDPMWTLPKHFLFYAEPGYPVELTDTKEKSGVSYEVDEIELNSWDGTVLTKATWNKKYHLWGDFNFSEKEKLYLAESNFIYKTDNPWEQTSFDLKKLKVESAKLKKVIWAIDSSYSIGGWEGPSEVHGGGVISSTKSYSSPSTLSRSLPGVKEKATCPGCKGNPTEVDIWSLVQHLNDTHRWTRNEIADWLETLDIDMEFKC